MTFFKYFNRGLAIVYLFGMMMSFTAKIGANRPEIVLTWGDAWGAVGVLASAVFIGFMAGRESKE